MSASSSAGTPSCCSRWSGTIATISSISCGSRSGRWSRRRSGSPARCSEDVATRMALWGVALAIVSTRPDRRLLGARPRAQRDPDLGRRGPSFLRALRPLHHHRARRIDPGDRRARSARPHGTPAPIAAFASAFVGTIAMWWLYFDIGAERAARQLAQDKDPGRMARLAYTYFHIPIVAGIIVTAASDEMAVAHPGGHAEPGRDRRAARRAGALSVRQHDLQADQRALFPALAHGRARPARRARAVRRPACRRSLLSLAATGDLVLVAGWELVSLRETRGRAQDLIGCGTRAFARPLWRHGRLRGPARGDGPAADRGARDRRRAASRRRCARCRARRSCPRQLRRIRL